MIQENCRIEKFKGFRFYEQDILFDDYMFSNDIELTIDLDYVSPGFGIALIDNEGYSIKEKKFAYLFKIGYREASIYYSTKEKCSLVKQMSVKEAATIKENMKLSFIKKGKKIIIKIDGVEILSEYTTKSIDKYNIGYYSNAGNIINNISIAAAIPDKWAINMSNTQGGYIKFYDNSFELTGCEQPAEIEQSNISLKAGKYYLKVEHDHIDNKCDIKQFVFLAKDTGLHDEEKNILKSDDSFFLMKDAEVNLKFKGKQGLIKKIMITDDKEDEFIPTTSTNLVFDGSYADVFLNDIKKVKFKGLINRTPGHLTSNEIFCIIMDSKTIITPQMTTMKMGEEYQFEFSKENYLFTITDKNKKIIYSEKMKNINNKITIFKNITAEISEFILVKTNGDQININLQDEYKRYINANISGPIIVLDKYDTPLDLSSSYRLCKYDDYEKYVFTNWEREYFNPMKKITLTNKIINKQDTLIVYGILKNTKYDLEKIYHVKEDNMNSINEMAETYEILFERDLLHVNKAKNILYLDEKHLDKYEMIIVDYLKDESYCINYHYNNNTYEVNISSLNKGNKTLYESKVISKDGDVTVTQVSDYYISNINGNTTGYIVLRKGGE